MSDKQQVIRSYPGTVVPSSSDTRVRGNEAGMVVLDEHQPRMSDEQIFCLCHEFPPAVAVPGRAAIEATLRQAKARELGDAASDPFEMETHEENR